MTQNIHNLKSISQVLLTHEPGHNVLNEAVHSLSKLFCEAVDFDELQTINQHEITTKTGKAISPRWAASCLNDVMRTRKFILGIRDAIEERLKLKPGQPVIVMYAGTGPFAALLTPLITVFDPSQLQLVLIEINPVSFLLMKKTVQQFEMKDYLVELVEADAVTYIIPENQQPDIIVSETMNNALQKEPQVSIVANLLSQCDRNPFLIPELIKVEACLLGDMNKNPTAILPLKTLVELNAEIAVRIKKYPETVPALSGIIVTIQSLPASQYKQLVLSTTIKVFGQHSLGYGESGLTTPHILMMTDSFKKYPAHLLFQYHINNNPGFSIRKVENGV